MELYAKQGQHQFLLVTGGDPKTRTGVGIVVDTKTQTVVRVKNVRTLLRQSRWLPLAPGDPTVEQLVGCVPTLRPYRGIEVRLPGGETAWIRWGEWWSESDLAQQRLTEATRELSVDKYEPDSDHFLATQAIAALGGDVLDKPRAVTSLPESGY